MLGTLLALAGEDTTVILMSDHGFHPRAVVWLADFWRGGFEEAQGGLGFGAVVVEAGVEALEGFRVVKPQDGTSQQGKHLASAGFLARTRGVFFP
jgi:hypothetical protein